MRVSPANRPEHYSMAARVFFGVALAAATALLLHYRLQVGFIFDDLLFLRDRSLGGVGTLLEPHNGNIVALQAAFYRGSFQLFGIGSPVPLQLLTLPVLLLSIVAFFAWTSRRVGEWAAAILAVPLLLLGTGYQDLIWSFQVGYTASLAAGLLALIVLEGDHPHRRIIACLALCVAVTSSSLGAPFLVAAAVQVLIRQGWKGLFGYFLLVPVALLLAWYVGWGRTAESYLSLANLLDSPRYVIESVKSVLMGLTGLHRISSPAGDILGWLATLVTIGVTTLSLVRRRVLPAPFLIALALGLSFWALASLNQIPGMVSRDPDQSRYQFPGAVFLLMILAGAFSGARPGRNFLAVLLVLAGISVVASLGVFASGSKVLIGMATPPKAALTALDLAGGRAVPNYKVRLVSFVPYFIDQDQLARLEERYGRAGWSERQVTEQSDAARAEVDTALVQALGIKLIPGASPERRRCREMSIGPGGSEVAELRSGEVGFRRASSNVAVSLVRFSDRPVPVGELPVGAGGGLVIPPDRAATPWRVIVKGEGRLSVCVGG